MAKITCDTGKQKVCIETVRTKGGVDLYAINHYELLPVTITLDFTLENLRVVGTRAKSFVLNGQGRQKLLKLQPRQNGRWSYDFRFDWSRGDITAPEGTSYKYRLPFKPGAQFQVTQSCNGQDSHKDAQRFAIDFKMPEGTPVHAARAGKVVSLKQTSDRGGPSEAYGEHANFIVIQHEDRTLGIYYHLRKNGVAVALGDRIDEGEMIGYSGNTGQSTGPHLHFAVTKATTGDHEKTLRFSFETSDGPVTCPRKGSYLRVAGER
ncbi:M23 family metallopeptidase [Primorskyibacter sp. 2E233]|uniref:M23 family metallopeptidase n=1 Tax=Primorskyibacter sp. 2E233 TaxID=3413431 RepID=UPI003BEFB623